MGPKKCFFKQRLARFQYQIPASSNSFSHKWKGFPWEIPGDLPLVLVVVTVLITDITEMVVMPVSWNVCPKCQDIRFFTITLQQSLWYSEAAHVF